MSFAAQTKKELTMVTEEACCQKSELSAILALNGSLVNQEGRETLLVETENVATARRIYTQIRDLYVIHPEVVVRRKMRLKKNNVYAIRMTKTQIASLLEDLRFSLEQEGDTLVPDLSVARASCCRRAYLRGAFLAAGSVNAPGSQSYHLEIYSGQSAVATYICTLMNEFELNAKIIGRKRGYVVYLKEGEKIVEFLNVIGAYQALLKFEDTRILKGMRNQVNRLVNCETANMNKTITAAVRQLEVIQYIDHRLGLQQLPAHLRQVAELRLEFPEANLQELVDRLGQTVSKSGLNHRFRKLEKMADALRDEA